MPWYSVGVEYITFTRITGYARVIIDARDSVVAVLPACVFARENIPALRVMPVLRDVIDKSTSPESVVNVPDIRLCEVPEGRQPKLLMPSHAMWWWDEGRRGGKGGWTTHKQRELARKRRARAKK